MTGVSPGRLRSVPLRSTGLSRPDRVAIYGSDCGLDLS